MSELTQEKVNEIFAEIKSEWDKKLSESGQRQEMFIATDQSGFVANFLYNYETAKQNVESQGLIMPELVKGLSVNFE